MLLRNGARRSNRNWGSVCSSMSLYYKRSSQVLTSRDYLNYQWI